GALLNIEDLREDVNMGSRRKAKYVGKSMLVPVQPVRTSGDLAFFLVDKPEYVFGIDPNGERSAEKVQLRARLFREQVESAAKASEDSALEVVVRFLRQIAEDSTSLELPSELGPGDLIAFRVGENGLVHMREAVKAYWKQQRAHVADNKDSGIRCLVTGEPI